MWRSVTTIKTRRFRKALRVGKLILIKMKKLLLYLTILILLLSGFSLKSQTTVSINPSQDNTLFEDASGSLSDGAGDHFFVGTTNANLIRRGLIKFNISSLIPAGSTITNVTLSLTMDKTISGPSNIQLHSLIADWGEGASFSSGGGTAAQTNDATWIYSNYLIQSWNFPGGDFNPTASASSSVNANGVYSWTSTQMKTDVQNWLNNPSLNFGWCVIGDESTYPTAKRFASKENASTTAVPVLTITYVQNAIAIAPLKDNTLFESTTGSLSNGAGDHFFVGKTNSNSKRRGLLMFDIASNIPAGATITGATLALTMDQSISGASNIDLHKVTNDWGEGSSSSSGGGAASQTNDATWIHRFYPNSFWAHAGGDFSSSISASTSVNGTGVYTWTSQQMINEVQNWLNNPSTNYGWCLVGNEATYPTAKRFVSKESTSTSDIPQLIIYYTMPACVNTTNTFSVNAIDSYTAPSGATYTSSQVVTDIIPNAGGCDSTITINLTVFYSKKIHLTAMLQGLYQGGGLMNQTTDFDNNIGDFVFKFADPQIVDTLSVLIRNVNSPDYNILAEYHGLNLHIDGSIPEFSFYTNNPSINAIYFEIVHRNSAETWSDPVSFATPNLNYNFYTNAVSPFQTGNMLALYSNNIYGGSLIWSGDIIQDGVINIFDLSSVFDNINDPNAAVGYTSDDVNGDGVVNIFDLSIVFDNLNLGAGAITPITSGF